MQIFSSQDYQKNHNSKFMLTSPVFSVVQSILQDIAERGEDALLAAEKQYSFCPAKNLLVPPEVMEDAFNSVDQSFLQAVFLAEKRISAFHSHRVDQNWQFEDHLGCTLGQLFFPIERLGVYVPGGKACYPSSLLMNVVPAKIAGVSSIAVACPADQSGWPNQQVLAVAHHLQIKKFYAIGGAQAIGAMAFGTKTVERVDKITGPGNAFVSEAKRQVHGIVGIDSLAGPSEVVVWLDDVDVDVAWLVEDLLAQAEHDESAKTTLITTDVAIAQAVSLGLKNALPAHPRRAILEQSLSQHSFGVVVQNSQEAIELINWIAPEHLEVFSTNKQHLKSIRNAGAIFWGKYSPEAFGDYLAGPNHTIPTAKAARFSSPLSVADFLKSSSFIEANKKTLQTLGADVITLAEHEGLVSHARSIALRIK